MRNAILWYALKYEGEWTKIANAIKNKEPFHYKEIDVSYITFLDSEYPACFRKLRYPPWILFYKGNIDLLKKRCIGIVGARNCTQKAIENTHIVVNNLKKRYCIVSGLAKGIDSHAHLESMNHDTIGIIGCGINRIYPNENKNLYNEMYCKQLVISEYPGYAAPCAYHFPWRNRLIAALSESLIVIEATCKSGTMTTVNEAIELSKTIYCLPTAFNDSLYEGCNYLISQGAMILSNEKELEYI